MSKTIFISGASSGIGLASALRLHSGGFKILAGVLPGEDITPLTNQNTADIKILPTDITKPDSVATTVAAIQEQVSDNGLFGLFNNAGIAISGPLEGMPIDAIRQQLEVNLIGHIRMTQRLLPLIRQGRGRIVNTTSILGRVAAPFAGPYAMSKYAMEAFTDTLRMELYPDGIHVIAIEPGTIATPIWDKAITHTQAIASEMPPMTQEIYADDLDRYYNLVQRQQGRAISPDAVAQKVTHAFTANRPRTRYVVGTDARLLSVLRTLLPDRAFDWTLNRLYPIIKR